MSDEVVETIDLPDFDPDGDPEVRREASGKLWLVFNFMPPSWVPEEEYKDMGRCRDFDSQLEQALGTPVLWDDREFFLIEHPLPDTVERIRGFLAEFRRQNEPAT